MPSALADALFQRLIDAFPPHHAYPAAAFEREPMPSPVAHFLSRLLERRLQHEASKLDLPRSSWLDAGHPTVQQARQALAEALVTHGHFPPEEWEPSLRQATEQTTAYLVQPTATLVAFVFQDGEQASSETIERRLGYFSGYRYLPDTVRLYMEQKGVPELTRARFADVLRQIDRQMTNDFDADDWLKMMKPLFALARHASPEASGVAVEVLQAFFEDKDAEVYVQRLQATREQGATTLDKDGIRTLLEGPAASPPPPEPERPAEPEQSTPSPGQPEPTNGPVPLWKQFRQDASPLAEQVTTGVRRQTAPRRPPPATEALPRWKQFRNESSPSEPAPSPSPHSAPATAAPTPMPSPDLATVEQAVLGTTGAHNRDLFIRHLFNGDRTNYEHVLSRLDTAATWTDASKIIASEVFRKNQVNIYSDPAVLFTDAVEARYRA